LHARQGPHPLENLVVELNLLLFARELVGRNANTHRQHVIGDETRMDAAEIPERTDHQGCANQQHQRQGDFGGDEQSARALAGGGRIEPPQPLLQRLVRIRFRHPPCRCHAGDSSTQQRRCERKREDRAVHLDVGQPGQAVAKVIHDQPGPEVRDDQSQGSPTHRQQQALRQHLPDDPGALRAKRRADGNLLPAIDTSREHQVRNVRARDQ